MNTVPSVVQDSARRHPTTDGPTVTWTAPNYSVSPVTVTADVWAGDWYDSAEAHMAVYPQQSGPQTPQPQQQSSAPVVTSVAVTSAPASGQTYSLGEKISAGLTFTDPVTVTGTPRLKIDMDPAHWGEKWAGFESGSGSSVLTFTHTVVEPNYSTQGIAVLIDSLGLNGGTIRSASGDDAGLGHGGLAHDPNHKVDWRQSSSGDVAMTPVPALPVVWAALLAMLLLGGGAWKSGFNGAPRR